MFLSLGPSEERCPLILAECRFQVRRELVTDSDMVVLSTPCT